MLSPCLCVCTLINFWIPEQNLKKFSIHVVSLTGISTDPSYFHNFENHDRKSFKLDRLINIKVVLNINNANMAAENTVEVIAYTNVLTFTFYNMG
jgi:hypothetical protein